MTTDEVYYKSRYDHHLRQMENPAIPQYLHMTLDQKRDKAQMLAEADTIKYKIMHTPVKHCCDEMQRQLKDHKNLVDVYISEDETSPEVCTTSDHGWGGRVKIDYCPWCGRKIEFEQELASHN